MKHLVLALQYLGNWKNILFCAVAFSPVLVAAQEFPDTIRIPVTFYDFHADGSNPEFNPETYGQGDLFLGMVANTLDSEKKPVRSSNLSNHYFNHYIEKWFRPWQPGDFTAPLYADDGSGKYVRTVTLDHDTSFKNIVIHDTLGFWHIGNGVYEYANDNFFMLDGRGFGNEPEGITGPDNKPHNYSFAMELHTSFTYQPNLSFDFVGDDDVWAFVDGKLAMDLGGIHTARAGTLNLNQLSGLTPGQKYDFDFFYCERRQIKSTIKVTTNLFTPISYLRIYPGPGGPGGQTPYSANDTVSAGSTVELYGHVFDSTQAWRQEFDDLVTWQIHDENGELVFSDTTGGSKSFNPTEAYGEVTVTATFRDPNDPSAPPAVTTINFFVGPGKPHHIEIIESATVSDSLNTGEGIDSMYLDIENPSRNVYAIVRDSLGNFVGFAGSASWQSENAGIAGASGASGSPHIGTITKGAGGETMVIVSQPGVIPDTLKVKVEDDLVTLVSATTNDVDGNGYLDRIVCVFDSSVDFTKAQQSLKVTYGSTTFEVDTITRAGSDTVFTIHLRENITEELQTGWKPTLSYSTFDVAASESGFESQDGAGPVIREALFFPGGLSGDTYDTLRVTFSEPVSWSSVAPAPSNVYYLYEMATQADDAFTGIAADDMNRTVSGAVIVMTNGFEITPERDSLQLKGGNRRLIDTTGNQPVTGGRKVAIRWGVENTIQFGVINNPFIVGDNSSVLPARVQQQYSEVIANSPFGSSGQAQGTIVGFQSLKEFKEESDGSYGSAIVYDALGNVVRDDLRVYPAQKQNNYGILWNGLNRNGRRVGRGTYLIIINVTDIDDKQHVIKPKIGIIG